MSLTSRCFKTSFISGLSPHRRSTTSKEDDAVCRVILCIRSPLVIHRCQVQWTHRQKLPTCTNIYQGVPVSTATTTATGGQHRNKGATSNIRNERWYNQDLNASKTERKKRKWRKKYEMCFFNFKEEEMVVLIQKVSPYTFQFYFFHSERKNVLHFNNEENKQCNEENNRTGIKWVTDD